MKTIVENRWTKIIDGKREFCKAIFTYENGLASPKLSIFGYNPFPFFLNTPSVFTTKYVFNQWMTANGWKMLTYTTNVFFKKTVG